MAAERLNSYERGALILRSTLSSNQRLFLLVVSSYGSASGRCFPARGTLADDCGVSVKTIDRCIRELAALSIIRKYRRRAFGGRVTSNAYAVDWSRLKDFQRPQRVEESEAIDDATTAPLFSDSDAGESQGDFLTLSPQRDFLTHGQGVKKSPSGASDCPPRGRHSVPLPSSKDLVERTHTKTGRQFDAQSSSDRPLQPALAPPTPDDAPPPAACASLIRDFYRRWFGPDFDPPMATTEEMHLAAFVLRSLAGNLPRATTMQGLVVDRMRENFPRAQRFAAADVEWRKRIAGVAKQRRIREAAAVDRSQRDRLVAEASGESARETFDRIKPQWDSLPESERAAFRLTLPPPVRGNGFVVVVAFATRQEEFARG